MGELIRPLNFADKLLRLLETAQNNCRTRRRYAREKDGQEENRRKGSAKKRINFLDDLLRRLLTRGTGCPCNEFIKYFIRVGRRESRSDAETRDGIGVAAGTKARENVVVQKDTLFIIRRYVTTLYAT